MRRFFKYGVYIYLIVFPVLAALLMSLTVVNKQSYKNTSYYRFARQQFAWTTADPEPKYALKAGWSNVSVLPPVSALSSVGNKSFTRDSVSARAVVLDNGSTLAAIIALDLPMMPPAVAEELQKKLPQHGFSWKNIYLSATHAKPLVGGWAKDYMGQQDSGDYDQGWVNQLVDTILQAVARAKANLATVKIGADYLSFTASHRTDPIHLLRLRKETGESAVIFTGLGNDLPPVDPMALAGQRDWVSQISQGIEKQAHCFPLFMVGAIQDAHTGTESANRAAFTTDDVNKIVSQIALTVDRQPLETDSTLIAQTTTLAQAHSDPQIRISQHWRLKSWLARKLYGDYSTELKALQVGKTVFVGFPGAVSSQLVPAFSELKMGRDQNLVLTSYNGGNIGQIVPDTYYYATESPYNIREINRFGPQTAQFMLEMTQSLVSSLK